MTAFLNAHDVLIAALVLAWVALSMLTVGCWSVVVGQKRREESS